MIQRKYNMTEFDLQRRQAALWPKKQPLAYLVPLFCADSF